MQRLRSSAD